MAYARTPVTARILRATTKTDYCWLWNRTLDKDGYGHIRDEDQITKSVHRVAYTRWVGEIPNGLEIDHICRVRNCVNPQHLEPVTQVENIRRSTVSEVTTARHKAVVQCPKGHAYTPANTIVQKSGSRKCRECGRIYSRNQRELRKRNGNVHRDLSESRSEKASS